MRPKLVLFTTFLLALVISSCRGATMTPPVTAPAPNSTMATTPRPTEPTGSTETVAPRQTATAPRPAQTASARPAGIQKDITYCTTAGVPLKLDLYSPATSSDNPAALVVYVHGGGWSSGDKSGGEGARAIPELVRRGYIVAAINYRLAPQYKWPAQIDDVKCAVRFLRANAATYNLDPNRIGAIGGSAGGHLVSMLGLAGPSAGFDVGQYTEQSSAVQVVVDLYGPSDLTTGLFKTSQAKLAGDVFGVTSPQDPILGKASPVTYITRDAPPFLILQGEKDTVVPPGQSQELYDRLKAAGVPVTLVMVKNAEHVFAPSGGAIKPTEAELLKMAADFIDKYLRAP